MEPGRQLERHRDREPLHAGLARLRLRRHGLRAVGALLEVAEARRADREPRPGAFLQKMRGRWRRDEPLAQRRRLQLRSHARQQGVHNERRGMRGDRQAHLRHGGRVRRTLGRRRRRLEHACCESPVRKSVRLCKRPRRLARNQQHAHGAQRSGIRGLLRQLGRAHKDDSRRAARRLRRRHAGHGRR